MRPHQTLQGILVVAVQVRQAKALGVVVRCQAESLHLAVAPRLQQSILTHHKVNGVSAFTVAAAAVLGVVVVETVVAAVGKEAAETVAAAAAETLVVAELLAVAESVAAAVPVAPEVPPPAATAAKASPILNFMQIWECEYASN